MKGRVKSVETNKFLLIYDLPQGPDRKRRQKTVTFRGTLKAADTELRRLITQSEGGIIDAAKMTVGELLDQFTELEVIPNCSPSTVAMYRTRIERYLKPDLGTVVLQKLTGLHIQKSYAKTLASGRIKTQTLRIAHVILRAALTRAVSPWGLIAKNPTDGISVERGEPAEKVVLDEEGTASLLDALKDTPLYVPAIIAAMTGLRRGEVLGLRWSDVDFDKQRLHVRQALVRVGGVTTFTTPKTKTGKRGIPIPAVLIGVLKAHRQTQKVRRIGMDLVCDDGEGGPLVPNTFSDRFTRLADKCGFEGVTPHSFRHGFATIILERGHSIETVRDLLGHSDIQTTAIYTHKLQGKDRSVADTMDDMMQPKKGKKKGTH